MCIFKDMIGIVIIINTMLVIHIHHIFIYNFYIKGHIAYAQSLERQQYNKRMSERNIKALLTQRAALSTKGLLHSQNGMDKKDKDRYSSTATKDNSTAIFSPDGVKINDLTSPISEYLDISSPTQPPSPRFKKIKSFKVDRLGVLNVEEEYFSAPSTTRSSATVTSTYRSMNIDGMTNHMGNIGTATDGLDDYDESYNEEVESVDIAHLSLSFKDLDNGRNGSVLRRSSGQNSIYNSNNSNNNSRVTSGHWASFTASPLTRPTSVQLPLLPTHTTSTAAAAARASSLSNLPVSLSVSVPSLFLPDMKQAGILTASSHFRNQLDGLMNMLKDTKPYYIRCIKPNTTQSPLTMQPALVLQQLRYSGLLEVIRLRLEGFPIQSTFREFYHQFKVLKLDNDWMGPSSCDEYMSREYTRSLASTYIDSHLYYLGNTKILLKPLGLVQIEKACRKLAHEKIIVIQAAVRMYLQKHKYNLLLGKYRSKPMFKRKTVLGVFVDEDDMDAEYEASNSDYDNSVRSYDSQDTDLNTSGKQLVHIYHSAIRNNQIDTLKMIFKTIKPGISTFASSSAMILARDSADNSIFHLAASTPKIEMFECLASAVDKLFINDIMKSIIKTDDRDRTDEEKAFYTKKTLDTLELLSVMEKEALLKSSSTDSDFNEHISLCNSSSYHEYNHNITQTHFHHYQNIDVSHIIPTNAKDSIKFGWLYKNTAGSTNNNDWKKRWCVIVGTDIVYYSSPSDTLPKGIISLRDCQIIRPLYYQQHSNNNNNNSNSNNTNNVHITNTNHIFQILSKSDTAKLKKRFFGFYSSNKSTSYFKAENEIELQEWLTVIYALANNIPTRYIQASHFINQTARQTIIQQVNAKNETPLHVLVRYAKNNKRNSKEDEKLDLLTCLYFLIRHGCHPDQKNGDGHTASEIAFAKNNTELLHWLRLLSTIHAREGMKDEENPLLLPCLKLPGYSYLSLVFRHMKYSYHTK